MRKQINLKHASADMVKNYYLSGYRVIIPIERLAPFLIWMQKQNSNFIKHEGKGIGDGLVEISYIK